MSIIRQSDQKSTVHRFTNFRKDIPVSSCWGEQVAGGAGAEDGSVVDCILGKPVRPDELLTVIADLAAASEKAPGPDSCA